MAQMDKPLTLTDLVDESERAKQVWFREYMTMGRFSTSYMREANILTDAAHHARKKLDIGNLHGADDVLHHAIRDASELRLASVQPTPAPKEILRAFLWMAEKEGLSLGRNAEGTFINPNTQRAWAMFQQGATWAEKRMHQPEPAPKKSWLK